MPTYGTGDNTTWYYWAGSGTSNTSAGTAVWDHWMNACTTATSNGDAWDYWATTANTTTCAPPRSVIRVTPPVLSAEQIQQREAEIAERTARLQREHEQRLKERRQAERRARVLLRSHLTWNQRRELKQKNQFTVISRDGQRTYQIRYGSAGNVKLVNPEGVVLRSYCIHPGESVPHEDVMLSQKLMLENDEQAFLRIANAS